VSGGRTPRQEAFKTTEFWAYIAAVVAVPVVALINDREDGAAFGAQEAMILISVLTFGYMLSRGIAKAGSRERQNDHDHD